MIFIECNNCEMKQKQKIEKIKENIEEEIKLKKQERMMFLKQSNLKRVEKTELELAYLNGFNKKLEEVMKE